METLLVLDASTRAIAVGIVTEKRWLSLERAEGDALETLFRLTDAALTAGKRRLAELDGVLFCAGPGSLLGLRLAAMAVSTWQMLPEHGHWNLRQYHSLALAAGNRQLAGETDFDVCSPFRRGQLNQLSVRNGARQELSLLDAETPAEATLRRYFVPNGTLAEPTPAGSEILPYPIDALPSLLAADSALFQPVPRAKVFVPLEPEFATWSAQRHRKR